MKDDIEICSGCYNKFQFKVLQLPGVKVKENVRKKTIIIIDIFYPCLMKMISIQDFFFVSNAVDNLESIKILESIGKIGLPFSSKD